MFLNSQFEDNKSSVLCKFVVIRPNFSLLCPDERRGSREKSFLEFLRITISTEKIIIIFIHILTLSATVVAMEHRC